MPNTTLIPKEYISTTISLRMAARALRAKSANCLWRGIIRLVQKASLFESTNEMPVQTPRLVCAPGNGDIPTRHRDMMNELLIEHQIMSKRFATENVPFREQSGIGGQMWLKCHRLGLTSYASGCQLPQNIVQNTTVHEVFDFICGIDAAQCCEREFCSIGTFDVHV